MHLLNFTFFYCELIMKNKFVFLFFIIPSILLSNYKFVNVSFDNPEKYNEFIGRGFDLSNAIIKEDCEITLILNNYEYDSIKDLFNNQIIYDNYEEYLATTIANYNKDFDKLQSGKYFTTGSYAGHFTTEEIYENFDLMMKKFPNLISKNEIGKSIEKRPIYAYCFGPFGCMGSMSYPNVMINGIHHAREPIGGTINVYTAWKLLENYENGEPEATFLLTNRNIVFVPIINPDGYEENIKNYPNGGGLWRKNKRIYDNKVYGVDINRNYGPENLWNYDGKNLTKDYFSEIYPGKSAFSEPETQAIQNLTKTSNFKTIFNYHTFGNLLIYPHGYRIIDCADSNLFRDFGYYLTRNSNYAFGLAGNLLNYNAQGASDDFHYSNNKALSFIIEVGEFYDNFYTRLDSIIPYCEQNYKFIKQLIWSADANLVVKKVDYENQNSKKILKIYVQNIGTNVSNNESLEINCSNEKIIIQNKQFDFPPINSGETIILSTELSDDGTIINGSSLKFHTNLIQNNIIKQDSFVVQYYQPRIYEIKIDTFLDNFKCDANWATNIDYPHKNQIITSNLEETYNSNMYSTIELPRKFFNCNSLFFEFDIQFGIELNFDFFKLQIFNTETGSWDNLRTDRMTIGSGLDKSTQKAGVYGFDGFIPTWTKQKVDISNYKNDSISIKFVLQTDGGTNKSGVKLKNLNFLAYEDLSDVEINSHINLELPEIIHKNEILKPNHQINYVYLNVELYNNIGILLQSTNSFDKIQTNQLNQGVYFFKITIDDKIYIKKFVLIE